MYLRFPGASVCSSTAINQRPVPNSIAIVGVDNDPILCRMANPPLSSMSMLKGAGYQAAACWESMMNQKKLKSASSLWVSRCEAFVGDTRSPSMTKRSVAARFILDEATKGINVSDVLNKTHLTRRAWNYASGKRWDSLPTRLLVPPECLTPSCFCRETSLTQQLPCGAALNQPDT